VINTFAQVDYLASAGRTVWHRASAITKLVAAMTAVAAAVFVPGWVALAVLLVTAIALTLTAQLPLRLILAAAATPILFALLFVLASWHGHIVHAAMLGMRPVISSLIALWLVGTTPYPDLFAPISRLMPRALGDGLFLTYRAVFSLLDRIERLWKALFLRGALEGPVRRRASMMGEAVGTVVLYGFERSQRLYQVMHLRGHSGRVCGCRHWLDVREEDAWVLALVVWVLLSSLYLSGVPRP
jgi:cobalt/nickel transport system permease protein